MTPSRIYHYTTRAAALEYILPTGTLRLGSLGLTNDPRETKHWGFQFAPIPVVSVATLDPNLLTHLQHAANRLRTQEWWALCATIDDTDLREPRNDRLDLTHFKYGHARARMWAQYAENHRGVCLVLDGAALHEAVVTAAQDVPVFHGAVSYADEWDREHLKRRLSALTLDAIGLSTGNIEHGLRQHLRTHCDALFLEKSKDWETEQEFRWLVNGTSGPYFVDISRALRTVVVGVDFPLVYGPTVWRLCDALGVQAERMHWNNRVPLKQVWERGA